MSNKKTKIMTTTELKHTVLCIPSLDMEARLIPNGESPLAFYDFGYANGYVGVHKGHPLYGVPYQDYDDKGIHLSVHGGVTFTGHIKCNVPEGHENWLDEDYWWIGFDTKHSCDTPKEQDKEYCLEELVSLACQLSTFTKTKY
jgi:hypothetical protein